MDNELYHYGIVGQKWGVRRFQNPDGTLTAAGQKRYATDKGAAREVKRANKTLDKYIKYNERERVKLVRRNDRNKNDELIKDIDSNLKQYKKLKSDINSGKKKPGVDFSVQSKTSQKVAYGLNAGLMAEALTRQASAGIKAGLSPSTIASSSMMAASVATFAGYAARHISGKAKAKARKNVDAYLDMTYTNFIETYDKKGK